MYAYTGWKNNNGGFTYISILLSLIIIASTLPILGYFISNIEQKDNQTYISVHQFFIMVQYDRNNAITVSSDLYRIYFYLEDGETAILEPYKNSVRRRVEDKGHEIYIKEVESFKMSQKEESFTIHLEMLNGEYYEKTFATK